MKKIAALLLLIVTTLPCMAQYGRVTGTGFANEHNLYYGIRLGWSLAAISSNVETVEAGTLKSGLHLGGVIGFQLSSEHPVYLESGLSYIEKGGKGDYKGEKHTYSLKYLLLPIVVKYRYELDDAFSVQPFVGGYFATGVGGKIRNYAELESVSAFSGNTFRRFDGGLRLGCGFEYQIMYAEACFDFGLANISRNDFASSHTRCLYFNIGVNF